MSVHRGVKSPTIYVYKVVLFFVAKVNESAVLNAIAMLQNGMCQEDAEHADMCAQAVEAILPVALEVIQRDRAWTQRFCRDTMHCHDGNHTPPPQ